VGCVTRTVLRASDYHIPNTVHALALGDGGAIRLRTPPGQAGLAVKVGQQYRIIHESAHGWRIRTIASSYSIRDLEERMILRYDWHPSSFFEANTRPYPHLHLGPGARVGLIPPRRSRGNGPRRARGCAQNAHRGISRHSRSEGLGEHSGGEPSGLRRNPHVGIGPRDRVVCAVFVEHAGCGCCSYFCASASRRLKHPSATAWLPNTPLR
jgi:hypothetical protein